LKDSRGVFEPKKWPKQEIQESLPVVPMDQVLQKHSVVQSQLKVLRFDQRKAASQVPFKSSVSFDKRGTGGDKALFMSRSFRVGWGPGGMLVHSGNPIGKVARFPTWLI
jgi:hypothetical protein